VLPYAQQEELPIDTHRLLSEEEGENNAKGVGSLMRKIRAATLKTGESTAICVHRPVLPHILDALDIAPATLVTGELLVAHLTSEGAVHALERHRPQE
jgi:8-oxo-dGTP diphosphatase